MILFTLSISLFDSLSTTQQIIIFVLLLTTLKPVRNALWYLLGLSGSYVVCGITGYLALDQLREFLGRFFPSTRGMSDPKYYGSELLTGIAMALIGLWYYRRKKNNKKPDRAENLILTRLRSMNGLQAFAIGIFVTLTSFPFSVPYIVALGKYSACNLTITSALPLILLYNIGYALPMILILAIYLFSSIEKVDMKDQLHHKARMLNVHLTTWVLVVFGIFSMIDAAVYFMTGHALLKGRYL